MPTVEVGSGDRRLLQDIADIMASSRKAVVVTGAGISTDCGIPVSGYLLLPRGDRPNVIEATGDV